MDRDEESKKLMIIDTDCGIDDAMALLLALSYGHEWELLAVTCCYGNTSVDNVCQNVLRVLVLTEQTQIPVYKGCTGPLVHNYPATSLVHGEDGFGNVAHHFTTGNLKVSEEHAAHALVRLVNHHPQRVTLAVLGPLTNIALALRIDPQFTHKLESLVFLGGNYKGIGNTTSSAEFNFHCDPEAANIVVTEAACPVTMVPWETTMEHGLDRKWYEEWISTDTKRGRFLKLITKHLDEFCHLEGHDDFLDCDILAVAACVSPQSVVATIRHPVGVELCGARTRGQAVLERLLAFDCKEEWENRNHITIVTQFDDEILKQLREHMIKE